VISTACSATTGAVARTTAADSGDNMLDGSIS